MHFMLGSLSLDICFFTIASKAMSGVKRPTLIPVRIIITPSGLYNICRLQFFIATVLQEFCKEPFYLTTRTMYLH